jgi:hypothetical protein
MALGTMKVTDSRMTGATFGSRCVRMMNQSEAPARRQARTYSVFLRESTCERTRREVVSHPVRPRVSRTPRSPPDNL